VDLFAFANPRAQGVAAEYAQHVTPGLSTYASAFIQRTTSVEYGAVAGLRWEW
jgi:hypothetical protein